MRLRGNLEFPHLPYLSPAAWEREGDALRLSLPAGEVALSLEGGVPSLSARLSPPPAGTPAAEFYGGVAAALARAAREAGLPPLLRWRVTERGVRFLYPFRGELSEGACRLDWADPLEEVVTLPEAAKMLGVSETAVKRGALPKMPPSSRRKAGGAWLLRRDAIEALKEERRK